MLAIITVSQIEMGCVSVSLLFFFFFFLLEEFGLHLISKERHRLLPRPRHPFLFSLRSPDEAVTLSDLPVCCVRESMLESVLCTNGGAAGRFCT